MTGPASLLAFAHVVGASFVAYLGLLVAGLGENRTPAEQNDAERLAVLMGVFFGVAVVWAICLLLRPWWIAVVAFVVESAIGAVLLIHWLDESVHSDEWVWILALAMFLTGAGALAIVTSYKRIPAS